MPRSLLLLFSLLLLVGCKNASVTGTAAVITLDNTGDQLTAGDIISVDRWVELAAVDEALISNVRRFSVAGNRYYILDGHESKVLIFNDDGSFASYVGQKGNGPGEYPYAYDFTVNTDSRRVIILSNQSTVYVYNLQGTFIERHKLTDGELTDIVYHNGRYVATTAYSSYPPGEGESSRLLYEFDADFRCIARWITYDAPLQPPHAVFKNRLQCVGPDIYYVDNIHTAILKVPSNRAAHPDTVLQYRFNAPMPLDAYADMMTFMSKQREHDWLADMLLSPETVLIAYVSEGNYCVSVNRWDGSVIRSGRYRGTIPETFCAPDGTMYSIISPDEYLRYWQSQNIKQPDIKPTDESNLLILRWKLMHNS